MPFGERRRVRDHGPRRVGAEDTAGRNHARKSDTRRSTCDTGHALRADSVVGKALSRAHE